MGTVHRKVHEMTNLAGIGVNKLSRPRLHRTFAIIATVAGLTLSPASDALAQVGRQLVVHSSANLRNGPSSRHGIIRLLRAGEHLLLTSSHPQNRYLNVVSGIDTGWVFSALVTLATESGAIASTSPSAIATVDAAERDYRGCTLSGNPRAHSRNVVTLRLLNQQKNRWRAPTERDIDSAFTLPHLLKRGSDDLRFNDSKAGEIEGLVVAVRVGGIETVNCHARSERYRDTHIEIADHKGATPRERVIVEITPRWRAAMRARGVDWTTPLLRSLIGKRVRFRGWQLFDEAHRSESRNTAPDNANAWRATAWELHPVTGYIITSP